MLPARASLLLPAIFLMAVACGGGDDVTEPASDTAGSVGETDATPTSGAGSAPDATDTVVPTAPTAGSSSDAIGSVTVGDESWNVVASECEFTDTGTPITLVSIVGHAEEDDSIEIMLEFDPTDTGLTLTVQSAGGDPDWTAVNETFAEQVGGMHISGEGEFSGGTETRKGSFDLRCP
jgi:hypothetical protein